MTLTIDIDSLTLGDELHLAAPASLPRPHSGKLLPDLLVALPPITTHAAYDFPAAMEDLNVQLLRSQDAASMDLSSGATLDSYAPFAATAGLTQIELFGEFSAGDWTVDLYINTDASPTMSQTVTLPAGTTAYRLLTRSIPLAAGDSVTIALTNTSATANSYTIRWFDLTPATRLAADALDEISTVLAAKPANFREQLVWLFHRFAGKLAFARTGQTATTQTADLTVHDQQDTALTVQTVTDDALAQDVSAVRDPEA